MKKNVFAISAAAIILAACATTPSNKENKPTVTEDDIAGMWVQPIPGMDGTQGILLEKGGKASSVNMYTLCYDKWELRGDTLILSGWSCGNGTAGYGSEKQVISKLTADSLTTTREGGLQTSYGKEANPEKHSGKIVKTVSGVVTLADERRTFVADGDTTECWIKDNSGFLQNKFVESKEPKWSAHVTMIVTDEGKCDEGFAAKYPTSLKVHNVVKCE